MSIETLNELLSSTCRRCVVCSGRQNAMMPFWEMSGYNAMHGHRGGGGEVVQKGHVQENGWCRIVQRALHPSTRCLTAHRRPLLPHQVSYLLAGVFDQEQPWEGWYSCWPWRKPNHGDMQFVCQSYSVQIPDMWHHLWGLWTSDIRTCLSQLNIWPGCCINPFVLMVYANYSRYYIGIVGSSSGVRQLLSMTKWYFWISTWEVSHQHFVISTSG